MRLLLRPLLTPYLDKMKSKRSSSLKIAKKKRSNPGLKSMNHANSSAATESANHANSGSFQTVHHMQSTMDFEMSQQIQPALLNKQPVSHISTTHDMNNLTLSPVSPSFSLLNAPLSKYLRKTNPPVYVISDIVGTELACQWLLSERPKYISFDTETSVTRYHFRNAPSTIQLATWDACFIIQIFRICFQKYTYVVPKDYLDKYVFESTDISFTCKEAKVQCKDAFLESLIRQGVVLFPPALRLVLEDPKIIKIGLNSVHDAQVLNQHYRINCRGVLDIQHLLRTFDLPMALSKFAKTYADPVYHDKTDSRKQAWKDHKKRYWDRNYLTEEEVQYGSKDVFAVLSAWKNFLSSENPSLLAINHDFDIFRSLPSPEANT